MYSDNEKYIDDVKNTANYLLDWDKFHCKKILITGASGLIGTFIIDVLMYRNNEYNDNIMIYALGRNKSKINERFNVYINSPNFIFIEHDIQRPISNKFEVDYIIHGASNTHPIAYATDPINTIMLSVLGTKNILEFALQQNVRRVLFLSSVEIYGENRGDVERFNEGYCGYIDSNTLRAGYPEGKKTAEALCQAYISKENMDIVIARCCRVYGPTMGKDDSKVIAQFIRNTVNNKPIVLKSNGEQRYSFCYVSDICTGLLTLLLKGKKGEAYNISQDDDIPLHTIADILANYMGNEVVFDIPSQVEASGYSKAGVALLDAGKLKQIGWSARYDIEQGIKRTLTILKANEIAS
jgi:nucleoside-diphosphate-sugar epimerase